MKPVLFASPEEFRKWLAANHNKKDEIFIQFYKKGSGKASMNIQDAQIQALYFGWIDGILRNTGPETFVLRFTPRRKSRAKKVGEINRSIS